MGKTANMGKTARNNKSAVNSSKKNPEPSILEEKELEIDQLKKIINHKNAELDVVKYQSDLTSKETIKVSKSTFFLIILVIACLGVTVAFFLIYKGNDTSSYTDTPKDPSSYADSELYDTIVISQEEINEVLNDGISLATTAISKDKAKADHNKPKEEDIKPDDINPKANKTREIENAKPKNIPPKPIKTEKNAKKADLSLIPKQFPLKAISENRSPVTEEFYDTTYFAPIVKHDKYKVISKAYVYNRPDIRTRGIYYMIGTRDLEISALEEEDGFVFVEYFTAPNVLSKGWMRKMDLRKIN